jgi:CubicO group peptidase (beta-lactamase class C family)
MALTTPLAWILSCFNLWHVAPSPREVLSLGPVTNLSSLNNKHSALHKKLVEELTEQLASGRQLGLSLCVYHHGVEIAHVVGGVFRSSSSTFSTYSPVTASTLFFVNSVTKGICATAFLTLVDRGAVSYSDPVATHWPAFSANGKSKVTVADALAHRAGLSEAGGNAAVCFLRCIYLNGRYGWRFAWDKFSSELASYVPEWPAGSFAAYHAVSFSWLMGGIVDGATNRGPAHVATMLHDDLATPLNIPKDDICLGRIPQSLIPSLAFTEPPPTQCSKYERCDSATREAHGENKLLRFLIVNLIGPIEGQIVAAFIGLKAWRDSCLPGNNCVISGRALGRIFGALANKGAAGGDRFCSESVVVEMHKRVLAKPKGGEDIAFKHPDGKYAWLKARDSCGFFPWACEDLQGHEGRPDGGVVGNEGMGGSFAYSDVKNGLAIAYCKSVYEPLAVAGGSVSVDGCNVARIVREHLNIK